MRAWKIVAIVGLLGLALCATLLVRWLRPLDLETERAAARAAGLPLKPEDLPLPQYPPSQDAAPIWTALAPMLNSAADNPAWKAVENAEVNGVLPPSANADLFRLVTEERPTLERIHAAAIMPGRSINHGWGPDVLFPEFARMRHAVRLLRFESLAMARRGRPVDAIRNQALGLRLAKQTDEDPILIGYLVAVAFENITLSGMADIACENPTPAVAAAIRESVARDAPKYDFERDLKGETLYALSTIHMVNSPAAARMLAGSSGAYDPNVLNQRPSAFMRFIFQEPSEAVYLHLMTKQIRAARLPRDQRERAQSEMTTELANPARKGPAYILPSLLLPVFARAYERGEEAMTRRAVLMAGADVLAWRAGHGAFPADLADATRAAKDPITGKPFGYRRTQGGFVVYRPSADGRFQGLPGKDAKGELYFSYPKASLNPFVAGPTPRRLPRRPARPAPTAPPMPGGPMPSGSPVPGGPPPAGP